MMQYLKRGFSSILPIIIREKKKIILLCVLQFLLIILTAFIFLHYQIKIIEQIQNVVIPLENANFDPHQIEAGAPFLENAGMIVEGYKNIKQDIVILLLWLGSLFIIGNGSIWALSHLIASRKKITTQQISQIGIPSLGLFLISVIISLFLLKKAFRGEISINSFSRNIQFMGYFLIFLYYLSVVAFTLAGNLPWPRFLRKIYDTSIKKIHHILPVFIITAGSISLSIYLFHLSLNYQPHFFVTLLSFLFFIVILVMTRILWITTIQGLKTHETDHS